MTGIILANGDVPTMLVCHQCPYRSACCRWGTWLTADEGRALLQEFGGEHVYMDQDTGRYRTQTKSGRCTFFADGCRIHNHTWYPKMCRDFPDADADDPLAGRAFDATSCPGIPIE